MSLNLMLYESCVSLSMSHSAIPYHEFVMFLCGCVVILICTLYFSASPFEPYLDNFFPFSLKERNLRSSETNT